MEVQISTTTKWEKNTKKRTKYIPPKKLKHSLSFHIKSNEKYTKIENNYSRRHGRYGGSEWECFLGCFFLFSVSLNIFCLCWFIWRRSSVICWGCLRRPPPGGAPRRPPPRPWCSRWSWCCRPWATGGPPPAPPDRLRGDGDRGQCKDTPPHAAEGLSPQGATVSLRAVGPAPTSVRF